MVRFLRGTGSFAGVGVRMVTVDACEEDGMEDVSESGGPSVKSMDELAAKGGGAFVIAVGAGMTGEISAATTGTGVTFLTSVTLLV